MLKWVILFTDVFKFFWKLSDIFAFLKEGERMFRVGFCGYSLNVFLIGKDSVLNVEEDSAKRVKTELIKLFLMAF